MKNQSSKSNELFIDKIFPPVSRSLYESNDSILEEESYINKIFNERAKNESIVWKRPNEFSDGSYTLFQEHIEPNDIKQVIKYINMFILIFYKLFLGEIRKLLGIMCTCFNG